MQVYTFNCLTKIDVQEIGVVTTDYNTVLAIIFKIMSRYSPYPSVPSPIHRFNTLLDLKIKEKISYHTNNFKFGLFTNPLTYIQYTCDETFKQITIYYNKKKYFGILISDQLYQLPTHITFKKYLPFDCWRSTLLLYARTYVIHVHMLSYRCCSQLLFSTIK